MLKCIGDDVTTEEDIDETAPEQKGEAISAGKQLKAAASGKYRRIIMIFYFLHQAGRVHGGYVSGIFCSGFFPSVSVFGRTMNAKSIQSLTALIGGIPLAAGMLFVWPVANKIGRRHFVNLYPRPPDPGTAVPERGKAHQGELQLIAGRKKGNV